MTNPSETDMNLNATDTTAKAISRLKNANNRYTMTFSAHAADGAEAMGYVVTSETVSYTHLTLPTNREV